MAHKDSFGMFMTRATDLLLAAQSTGIDEFREQVQLDFAYRLLSSEVLGKRNKGTAEIGESINCILAGVQSLSDDLLEALNERVQEKPFSEYQESDLQLLYTFTVNLVSVSMTKPVKSWFGVDIFWRMLQDDAKVSGVIADSASTKLCNLLWQPTFASQKVVYLDKCVTALQKGECSLQCLRLIKMLVQIWEAHNNLVLSDLILTLEAKFSLLNLLLAEATRVQAQNYLAKHDTNLDDFRLPHSRHSHSSHMRAILEVLDYILSNSSLILLKSHLCALWEVFILRSVTSQDSELLLQWLKACISLTDNKRRCKTLSLEGVEYVFKLLSSASDIAHLSIDGYHCFESYFLYINSQAGFLLLPSHINKHMTVTDFNELRGIDALWRIAEHCGVPEAAAASAELLVTMHIRQGFQTQSQDRRRIFEKFISHIFKVLQDMIKNLRTENAEENFVVRSTIMRLVDALNSFLSRCADSEFMPKFVVGQKIVAHWRGQMLKTYSGIISAVNPIGSYAVRFDDGDVDDSCPAEHIYLLDGAVAAPSSEDNVFPHQLIFNSDIFFGLICELLSISDIEQKLEEGVKFARGAAEFARDAVPKAVKDLRLAEVHRLISEVTQRRASLLSPSLEVKCDFTIKQAVFHVFSLRTILRKSDAKVESVQFSDLAIDFSLKCETVRRAVQEKHERGLAPSAEEARDALVISQQKVCEERLLKIESLSLLVSDSLSFTTKLVYDVNETATKFELKEHVDFDRYAALVNLNSDSHDRWLKPLQNLLEQTDFDSARDAFLAAAQRELFEATKFSIDLAAWEKAELERVQLQVSLLTHLAILKTRCKGFELFLVSLLKRLVKAVDNEASIKIESLKAEDASLERARSNQTVHLAMLKQFAQDLLQKEVLSRQYWDYNDRHDELVLKEHALKQQLNRARQRALPLSQIEEQLHSLRAEIATLYKSAEHRQLQSSLRRLGAELPEIIHRFPELDPLWCTAAEGIDIRNLVDYNEHPKPLVRDGKELPNILRARLAEKEVVIKKFAVNSKNLTPLRRSAHIMCRVSHPNIMPLSAVVKDKANEEWYLEVPYYPRGDLRQWLNQAKMPVSEIKDAESKQREAEGLEILRGLLHALDILHQVGIIHRDVKPENVLLEEFPLGTNRIRAVLADFEASKDLVHLKNDPMGNRSMIATTGLIGSGYVDPGVMQGQVHLSSASDMYAFGVVAGEVLTGCKLNSVEQVDNLSGVDEQIKEVLRALLTSAHTDRPNPSALLAMPLFSPGADTRYCCITLEQYIKSDGIECDNNFGERHFISHASLTDHVKTESLKPLEDVRKRQGKIFCPMRGVQGCKAPAYTEMQVAQSGHDAFQLYLQALIRLQEQNLISKFEVEKAQQIKLEVERLARMDAHQREVELAIRHIQDDVLTLKCPRCKTAFVDFTDCFALKCNNCPCAFCAWCLADCGEEAHRHVAHCQHNLAPGRAVFSTRELFLRAHRERQERLIREFMHTSSSTLSAAVLSRLEVNLKATGLEHVITQGRSFVEREEARALALQLEVDELACFRFLDAT